MSDQRELLRRHIGQLIIPGAAMKVDEHIASAIIANPQAHVDALVEAGVLELCGKGTPVPGLTVAESVYRVVQPHKHEWRVLCVNANPAWINVRCDCGEIRRSVPNRLPIEVPE